MWVLRFALVGTSPDLISVHRGLACYEAADFPT